MEIDNKDMESLAQDVRRLIEKLRRGDPYEQAATRMASKCFNMGMSVIMQHKKT